MRLVVPVVLLVAGVVLAQQPPMPAPTETSAPPDELTVKAARLGTTGAGLVEFFNKRARRTAEARSIEDLIKQLGDKNPETRDRAFGGLVELGPVALPLLRQAAASVDEIEIAPRAKECIKLLEGDDSDNLLGAAARLLAEKNPPRAVEALLAYLPVADNVKLAQELESALADLVLRDARLQAGLTRALKDPVPVVRAATASVLCQVGDASARAAVKALLTDSRPIVRLRTALGLARRSDAEAVPVLFDLLAELPEEYRSQIEDFLIDLAGDWKVELPEGKTPLLQRLRREVWAGWWKGLEGKALLEEVRRRTLNNEDRDKVQALIRDLGKENERERQQALLALIEFGPRSLPMLRQAADDSNSRISEGARRGIEHLQKDGNGMLPPVAVRLLALHRPEGTVEALLALIPFADSEPLSDALTQVLPDVAVGKDGKVDPALVKALADPVKVRRLAAIDALAQVGGQQDALKKLLSDKDNEIRLKSALALARSGDRETVPALITLVSELPPEQAWPGDEYLSRLAGAKKPAVSPAKEEEGQKKYREAWLAWWKEQGDKVALAERAGTQRMLGYTVVVEQYNQFTGMGRILELDAAGKTRWEFGNLHQPMDARVIGDRVLVAEHNLNQVSERDFKGEVKWQKQVNQPIHCERLRNGNTFIVRRYGMLEVDREGREIFHVQRNSNYMMAGGRLRDGTLAFVDNNNMYFRLDRQGRDLKSFRVPHDPRGGGLFPTILPNGHVLLSHHGSGKVLELDRDGKTIWEGNVQWPHLATRLSNGNTLVSSINSRKVTELDRSGKTIKEWSGNYQPYRAERR